MRAMRQPTLTGSCAASVSCHATSAAGNSDDDGGAEIEAADLDAARTALWRADGLPGPRLAARDAAEPAVQMLETLRAPTSTTAIGPTAVSNQHTTRSLLANRPAMAASRPQGSRCSARRGCSACAQRASERHVHAMIVVRCEIERCIGAVARAAWRLAEQARTTNSGMPLACSSLSAVERAELGQTAVDRRDERRLVTSMIAASGCKRA